MNDRTRQAREAGRVQTNATRALRLPSALAVVTLVCGASACSNPSGPVDAAVLEASVGADNGVREASVVTDDAGRDDGGSSDAELRLCVPGPGPDGSIEFTYFDGGVVGYGQYFADGGSVLYGLDGAIVGSLATDENEMLIMGGPCQRIV